MNDRPPFSPPLHSRPDGSAPRSPAAVADWLRSAAIRFTGRFRSELERAYGWTDLTVAIERREGTLVVSGRTALASTAASFAHGLRNALGPAHDVVVSVTDRGAEAAWYALRAPVTRVWRDVAATVPATELLRTDGPVQLVARSGGASLIRGADGTTGWTRDALGSKTTDSRPPVHRSASWADAARSFIGVPYRSGGTTHDGVDCSGLTQRLHRLVGGVTIPRHSRDQFALAALRTGPPREGQLVFINGAGESPFHVGLAIRRGREWSVVHASSTRGVVVEDPYGEYVQRVGDGSR